MEFVAVQYIWDIKLNETDVKHGTERKDLSFITLSVAFRCINMFPHVLELHQLRPQRLYFIIYG